jgi:competence protein ComEA
MFKKLLAALLAFAAASVFAAVDVNKANQADLESVKGIGPSVATKILNERKKAPFKNWEDMIDRVQGVGPGNAAKFSEGGLTVNGATFSAPAAAKKEKAEKPTKAEKAEKADKTEKPVAR